MKIESHPDPFKISDVLKPHSKALAGAVVAAIGEGIANLLDPWPLKIVIDNILKSQSSHGWLNQLILRTFGQDKLAILKFAALAALVIAGIGALCSYTEKYHW